VSTATIRQATTADVSVILHFIRELARYEKLEHEVLATEEQLRETLFGATPRAEVVIAESMHASDFSHEPSKPTPVGFALFFHNYSTFRAAPGLYLEDLYVAESHRGQGIGHQLLQHLADLAVARNCARFEWWVLDWNKDAIRFYERIGAKPMSDWTVFRLDGDALKTFAKAKP
jgi:GNAT superfamily N-acetyltransferase